MKLILIFFMTYYQIIDIDGLKIICYVLRKDISSRFLED